MLSVPDSSFESFAISSSNRSYSTFPNLFCSSSLALIHRAICYELFDSHMPSQPIMMKCRSFLEIFVISGHDVIAWCSSPKFLFYLNSKSPNARLRFKHPFTRPLSIYPPAFFIRFYSSGTYGLWSLLRGLHSPL